MAFLPNQQVPVAPGAASLYDAWLGSIEEELDRPDCDRYELCRSVLTDIYFPDVRYDGPASLPLTTQVSLAQMDARNVTREPEYYADTDPERYDRVKPLLWMWEMFDKSPLGENVYLGLLFRRMMAKRIFRTCGENFKAFHFVKLSFGYNMDVGDDVVVHRHVLLDDRGGIKLSDRASVSDFANIYSHSHDVVESREIETPQTVIGEGARITYHATVMSGVHVADNCMVGSFGVVTRDTEPDSIYVGIPAKMVKKKPGASGGA